MKRHERYFVVLVCACAFALLVGCSSGGTNTVQKQIAGNQGLLLNIQNPQDLANLYVQYTGSSTPGAKSGGSTATTISDKDLSHGTVQIGEINLLLQNVGSSATAGGLYVSGYDPNLISVCPHFGRVGVNYKCVMPGEQQTQDEANTRDCSGNVVIGDGGRYDIIRVCENPNGILVGARVSDDNGGGDPNLQLTIGQIPMNEFFDYIASQITKDNVGWFTQNGIFTDARTDCSRVDGKNACRISFGNAAFDVNRARHGFLLLNLMWDQVAKCANNCWTFPPKFAVGQVLNGVSDTYPVGDSVDYSYDIFLKREAWNPLVNDMPQTIQLTACYLYTTTVTPTVCVDPDPTSNWNEPCSSTPIIFDKKQGAPVVVTRIDQSSRPGVAVFTIYLQHVGNGQLWQPSSIDQCGPYSIERPDRRKQDVVQLLEARMSGDLSQLHCSPQTDLDDGSKITLVRFQNGVGQLTCVYPVSQQVGASRQAYTSSLSLEFGYIYQNVVQQNIVIHRT